MSAQEVIAGELSNWPLLSDAGTDMEYGADLIINTLKAAGYEVVKLPDGGTDEMGAPTWPVIQHWNGTQIRDGEVRIRSTDGRISATSVSNPNDCPEDARSLAAALLAAANTIEMASVQ